MNDKPDIALGSNVAGDLHDVDSDKGVDADDTKKLQDGAGCDMVISEASARRRHNREVELVNKHTVEFLVPQLWALLEAIEST